MKSKKVLVFPCVVLAILSLLLIRGGGAKAAETTSCGTWSIVPSANTTRPVNYLLGVAAISTNDVWAVGYTSRIHGDYAHGLLEHWDGTQWSVAPFPFLGSASTSVVSGVAAVSTNNVWAVGYYIGSSGPQLLALHWNGAKWSLVPAPAPANTSDDVLDSVTAIASNDVWAVGYQSINGSGRLQTLTEHWNGSKWSIIASPASGSKSYTLSGVTAVSSNDVWAVGQSQPSRSTQTLTIHWDGSKWSVVSSPNSGSRLNGFQAVSATATNDVWAVGDYTNSGSASDYSLIEHWDGSQWNIVTSPGPTTTYLRLASIAAISSSNAWTVGYYIQGNGPYTALIEHWDGTQWNIFTNTNLGANDYLNAVAAVPTTSTLWAVGQTDGGSGVNTLTAYYC